MSTQQAAATQTAAAPIDALNHLAELVTNYVSTQALVAGVKLGRQQAGRGRFLQRLDGNTEKAQPRPSRPSPDKDTKFVPRQPVLVPELQRNRGELAIVDPANSMKANDVGGSIAHHFDRDLHATRLAIRRCRELEAEVGTQIAQR